MAIHELIEIPLSVVRKVEALEVSFDLFGSRYSTWVKPGFSDSGEVSIGGRKRHMGEVNEASDEVNGQGEIEPAGEISDTKVMARIPIEIFKLFYFVAPNTEVRRL